MNMIRPTRLVGPGPALPTNGLPLFDWANAHATSFKLSNLAAAKLARRFGLSLIRAALIAEFAGFCTMEADHG